MKMIITRAKIKNNLSCSLFYLHHLLRKKGKNMSLEKAKEHLKIYNLENRVLEFTTSSATVKEQQ